MSFEEIMETITNGLTGDAERDLRYLTEQAEKYKDSEYSKEISRACGRLMYERLPEEKREAVNAFADNHQLGIKAAIDEANFNVHRKNYNMAEKILSDMVKRVEKLNMYQDDKVSEYHSFREPMQDVLYGYLTRPEKKIRHTPESFSELYLAYGSYLFEVGRYEEAKDALAKAYRWNPADPSIIFEYGETYKILGDMEVFFDLNRKAFDYSIRSRDVARCCRNAAYYFVEKEEWEAAVGYLLRSMPYDKGNLYAQSELFYIQNKTGNTIDAPSPEEMEKIAEKYDIPLGTAPHVVELSYHIAKQLFEDGNFKMAYYFGSIAFDLTDDKQIRQLLDSIKDHEEQKGDNNE